MKKDKEALRIALAPPSETIHTPEGDYVRGDVLVNRPVRPDEIDGVRRAVEALGLVTTVDGKDENAGSRSFGPPRRWNTRWEPKPIWGKGNQRND